MNSKTLKSLEESSDPIELLENVNPECTLLEPVDPEPILLEEVKPIESLSDDRRQSNVFKISFGVPEQTTRRVSSNIESRMDSALLGLIEQRMQTKALPLALRKRLMYQRAISA